MDFGGTVRTWWDKLFGPKPKDPHFCPLCEDTPGVAMPARLSYEVVDKGKSERHEFLADEWALAYLFAKDLIFVSAASQGKNSKDFRLCVLCSDTFAWATADAEPFHFSDLGELYDLAWKDPVWGTTVWVVKKRRLRPMAEVVKGMKEVGVWEAEFDEYPSAGYNVCECSRCGGAKPHKEPE